MRIKTLLVSIVMMNLIALISSASSGSREIKIWRVEDGVEVYTFREHENIIESVTFSPTGDLIVSSSADKLIRMWHLKDGEQISTIQGDKGGVGGVNQVTFSPDGTLLISASSDGTVGLWGVHQ